MLSIDPKICNGCSLCVFECKRNAIRMEIDAEGFRTPRVNSALCNNCNACNEQCPVMKCCIAGDEQFEKKVFACQAIDQEVLIEATAGGFFPVLAKKIIDCGGVVFGASYDENMKVVHKAAYKLDDIKTFSGSKYVQSDIEAAIKEVYSLLNEGKTVLFSGTPCQIDAVKTACRDIDQNRLFTMDVVCYGVPSPSLFRSFLDTLEHDNNTKVVDFRFRDKHEYGWSHTTVITYKNNAGDCSTYTEQDYAKIPYYNMFGHRECFRQSCYKCKYNTLQRYSDITTGNFWGIEHISTMFQCDLGVSMVIFNTDKGLKLFEEISDNLIVEERTIEEAVSANDALVKGVSFPKRRNEIYQCYEKNGFEYMYKKYYSLTWYRKIRKILSIIRRKLFSNRTNRSTK